MEVPGHDGKAGMAAIVGDVNEKTLSQMIDQLKSNLQEQSVPIFYRKVSEIPKTANFKAKKVELASQAYTTDDVGLYNKGKLHQLDQKLRDQLPAMKL